MSSVLSSKFGITVLFQFHTAFILSPFVNVSTTFCYTGIICFLYCYLLLYYLFCVCVRERMCVCVLFCVLLFVFVFYVILTFLFSFCSAFICFLRCVCAISIFCGQCSLFEDLYFCSYMHFLKLFHYKQYTAKSFVACLLHCRFLFRTVFC